MPPQRFVLVGFTWSQVTHPLGHEKASTGRERENSSSPSKGTLAFIPGVRALPFAFS